jgi:NitT/TauT family transport system substrate-binding protein
MAFRSKITRVLVSALLALAVIYSPAHAQTVKTVRFGLQWGIAWMPYIIMQQHKIIERRAKEAGLGEITTDYRVFSGGNVMNDALLADQIEYATTGVTNFLILWDKARTVMPVKAVSGFATIPYALVTRNPKVKSMKDFSETDKIALPAVKISAQAVLIQMVAAKEYGLDNYKKFDSITISRSMPDGMAAVLSGIGEINSHFSSPPYLQAELRAPGVHTVLKTSDVLNMPISNGLLYATQKFHDQNPKLFKVVMDSLQEAIDYIYANKRKATEEYLQATKEKTSVDELIEVISAPDAKFTLTPSSVYTFASFMHKVGTMKTLPPSWKDFFFSEIHDLPGN